MKKIIKYLLFGIISILLKSCFLHIDPDVSTVYMKGGDSKSQRSEAISRLYEHYIKSKKNRAYYEIVAKKEDRFILNYYPEKKLLTLCTDPGSGWSGQFKNVDEAKLKELVDLKLTFDDINNLKGPLEDNRPRVIVKTNGTPS